MQIGCKCHKEYFALNVTLSAAGNMAQERNYLCVSHIHKHTLTQSYSPSTDTVCREANIAILCVCVCGFRTPAVFLQQGLDKVLSLLRYVLKTLLIKFVGGSSHKHQSLSVTVPLERTFSAESRT